MGSALGQIDAQAGLARLVVDDLGGVPLAVSLYARAHVNTAEYLFDCARECRKIAHVSCLEGREEEEEGG